MTFLKKLFVGPRAPVRRRRQKPTVRLQIEGLEERTLMAAALLASPINDYTPGQTFYMNNGNAMDNYWINVPQSYDATHQTPTQLFIWSHGCGGQSQWDINTVASKAGDPTYVTIALDGREGGCWNMSTDSARVMAAIDDIQTHFNIDPERVVLGGYSSGGDLSYNVAFTHSTEIAGVLAADTSPFRDAGLTQAQALAAPSHFNIVHLAHTGDMVYPIDSVRAEIAAVRAAGAPGDGWASLELIERAGGHWENDNGNFGTQYDIRNYLLPHLGDGWTSSDEGELGDPPPGASISATAAFEHINDWEGGSGFTGSITLTNTGNSDINGWSLEFDYSGSIPNTDIWNAQIVSHVGNHYVIQNADWNATIAAGQSVDFGFNVYGGTTQPAPTNYEVNGVALANNQPAAFASFAEIYDWGSGLTGSISLANTGDSDINGWTLEFDFTGNIYEIWSGQVVSHVGDHYVIQSADWNAVIAAGQSVSFGFNADWGNSQTGPTNYKLNGVAIGQI